MAIAFSPIPRYIERAQKFILKYALLFINIFAFNKLVHVAWN